MEVVALLLMWLVFFDLNAVCVGVGIVANAGDLPGNLDVGFVSTNGEPVVIEVDIVLWLLLPEE